jgi:hypothetical protein
MDRVGLFSRRRSERERERVRVLIEHMLHSTFWTSKKVEMLEEAVPALNRRERSPLEIAHMLTEAVERVEG